MDMKSTDFKIISPSLQVIITPILMVVSLLMVTVFGLRIGISKIIEQQGQLKQELSTEKLLIDKESRLQEIKAVVVGNSDTALLALPTQNSVLSVINQVKALSNQYSGELSGFKTISQGNSDTVNSLSLSFNVKTTPDNLFLFLNSLSTVAPITKFNKVDVKFGTSEANANITLSTFWSEFPTKLPALDQPLQSLTNEDQETLNMVNNLKPAETVKIEPNVPGGRGDPFVF